MDNIKKFTTNDLVILGGSVFVFLGYFFKWFKAESSFVSVSVSGSDYFLQGTLPWLLTIVVAASIIIRKLVPTITLPDLPIGWSQIYLIINGIVIFLLSIRIIFKDEPAGAAAAGFDVSRGLGLFMAFIGGVAMIVGAVLKFVSKEEDGATPPSNVPPTPF